MTSSLKIIQDILTSIINNEELNVCNIIGEGEFGHVLKVVWRKHNKEAVVVAVKTLRKENVERKN